MQPVASVGREHTSRADEREVMVRPSSSTCDSSVGSAQIRRLRASSIERDAVSVRDRRGRALTIQKERGEQGLSADLVIAPLNSLDHRKLQNAQYVICMERHEAPAESAQSSCAAYIGPSTRDLARM